MNIPRWILVGGVLLVVAVAVEWVFRWLVLIVVGTLVTVFALWFLVVHMDPKGIGINRKQRKR